MRSRSPGLFRVQLLFCVLRNEELKGFPRTEVTEAGVLFGSVLG